LRRVHPKDEDPNPLQPQPQPKTILTWFLENLFGGTFEGDPDPLRRSLFPIEVEILNEARRLYQLQQTLDATLPYEVHPEVSS